MTLTSDEFDADIGRAEKATVEGPVFITDAGRPTHVFMSFDEYRRLMLEPQNAIEADAMAAVLRTQQPGTPSS